MKSIFNAIKNRFDCFNDDIAQGITNGDWKRVVHGISTVLLMIAATTAICLLILMGTWKFLHSFWGKRLLTVIGGVLLICLLYVSHHANKGDNLKKMSHTVENLHLEVWAENVYEYVRDALFLVLRAVSEHTEIVMPTSPGAVELPNRISIKDGYVVFNFFAKIRNPVDSIRVKQELNRTLSQLTRAHELSGIPSELVLINGVYYCPLLILDVLDFGDSINISVVFANEKTVEIAKARKQLNLGRFQKMNLQGHNIPYDDQL